MVIKPLQVRRGVGGESAGDSPVLQTADTSTEKVIVIPAAAPIRFAKGTVQSVDCSATPSATLTLDSSGKILTLKVADTKHALVLGAGAFSCDWKKQKVAINYRETGDAGGTVVSIEIQ
jgi:hypothetical protein